MTNLERNQIKLAMRRAELEKAYQQRKRIHNLMAWAILAIILVIAWDTVALRQELLRLELAQ